MRCLSYQDTLQLIAEMPSFREAARAYSDYSNDRYLADRSLDSR